MISRKDAMNMRLFTQWQEEDGFTEEPIRQILDDHAKIISKIYDSIGSCKECKHHELVNVKINGVQDEDEIACTRGSFDPVEPNFFCADFEMEGT